MNLSSALASVRALVARYPARVIAATAAAVVFAAAKVGIVVPQESVVHALELIVPVLLSGEATHRLVSPAALLEDAEAALAHAVAVHSIATPVPVAVATPSGPVAVPAPVAPAPEQTPNP